MIDEKGIRIIAHWILKIVVICICIYIVFINIHHLWNGFTWLVNKCMPFIIGIVLATMLNIPLNMIEKHLNIHNSKVKRFLSIVLSLLCTLGLFVLLIVLIVPEFYHAITMIIDLLYNTLNQLALPQDSTSWITSIFKNIDVDWMEVRMNLETWVQSSSGNLMNQVIEIFKNTASILGTFFISLVFSIYLLANKELLLSQVNKLMDVWINEKLNDAIYYIFSLSMNVFSRFIVSQVTEAIILGLLCGLGMAILRIPYAVMIGVFIGVTALVPYLGAFLGIIVGFVLIVAVNPWKAIVFIIYVVIVQQIEGNVIYPKVVGNKVKLAPIWIFTAVMLGGSIAGPFGMFFAVPIASILYSLIKKLTNKKKNEMRFTQ